MSENIQGKSRMRKGDFRIRDFVHLNDLQLNDVVKSCAKSCRRLPCLCGTMFTGRSVNVAIRQCILQRLYIIVGAFVSSDCKITELAQIFKWRKIRNLVVFQIKPAE